MTFARIAFTEGFSPVGAVLVTDSDDVLASSSRREIGNAKHAELLALETYQDEIPRFPPLTLYSTLEPCLMCAGMATVMNISRIAWLVSDFWGGARFGLNFNSPYIQKRWPTMDQVWLPELHREATEMWIDYLKRTGHADAVQFMLGIDE